MEPVKSKMDYFLYRVGQHMVRWPTQRRGQAMVNVLYWSFHDCHELWMQEILRDHEFIAESPLDPFYQDERIPAFLEWLQKQFD